MLYDRVILSHELEADWRHTIDFISQNVQPLSKLTITLDMCRSGIEHRYPPPRTVSCDEVVLPLRKLQGLQDISVHLSENRNLAEEFRLEYLALGGTISIKHCLRS
jgi:hypothetical protein